MTSNLTKLLLLGCLFWLPTRLAAQTVSYDDVAVIVNTNSQVSMNIGNYFLQQRGIPASHLIQVAVSTAETVDSMEFVNLRNQVEAALNTNNLADSINYLVTTKGMPLRISRQNACDTLFPISGNLVSRCTCVESELPLILSPYAGEILNFGLATNPYAGETYNFDRDSAGIFLVTRLDGFTEADVKALIDRSGPDQHYFAPSAQVLLDFSFTEGGTASLFKGVFDATELALVPSGLAVINDTIDLAFRTNVNGLIANYGIHFRPDSLQQAHQWEPGGIALFVVDNAGSFAPGATANYTLGDVIAEGASAAAGYVYPSYFGSSTEARRFFQAYLDTTQALRYNVAEAYYQASSRLGQQNLLIADPKTSVIADLTLSASSPWKPEIEVYPNPATGSVFIAGELAAGEVSYRLHNSMGQLLRNGTKQHGGGRLELPVSLAQLATGMYILEVGFQENRITRRVMVTEQ